MNWTPTGNTRRYARTLTLLALLCLLAPGISPAQDTDRAPVRASRLLPPAGELFCTGAVGVPCRQTPGAEVPGANCSEFSCPGLGMCVNTEIGARCIGFQPIAVPPIAGGPQPLPDPSEPPDPFGFRPICVEPLPRPVQPHPIPFPGNPIPFPAFTTNRPPESGSPGDEPRPSQRGCRAVCGEGAACIDVIQGGISQPMCIRLVPMPPLGGPL